MDQETKETEENGEKESLNLYLPNRITKPENWQFIKLVAPNGEKKRWKTNECKGAYCERCKVRIVYNPSKGNTKQIQNHMNRFHAKKVMEFKNKALNDKNTKRPLIGMEKFVTKKQKINDMLPASEPNQAIADALLTLWVAKSLRPFTIVEDEGLVDFINYAIALQRKIDLPSRKLIRKNLMKLAVECFNRMNKEIKDRVDYFALTTDIWSSRTMQSFMALTLYAVTEEFDMIDLTLEVKPLTDGCVYQQLQHRLNVFFPIVA